MKTKTRITASTATALLAVAFAPATVAQSDLDLVFVEGGPLPEDRVVRYENPVPPVDDFLIGRTEVTASLYDEVWNWALDNGYENARPSDHWAFEALDWRPGSDFPMTNRTGVEWALWFNALTEYVNATTGSNLTPVFAHPDGGVYRDARNLERWHEHQARAEERLVAPLLVEEADGFRPPTESEHVFAAMGGLSSRGYRFAGSDDGKAVAWVKESGISPWNPPSERAAESGRGTWPVGLKQPNELGLFDMTGNAAELALAISTGPSGAGSWLNIHIPPGGQATFAGASGGSSFISYDPIPELNLFEEGVYHQNKLYGPDPLPESYSKPRFDGSSGLGARIARSPSALSGGEEPVEGEPGVFRHPDYGTFEWLGLGSDRLWSYSFGAEIGRSTDYRAIAASPQLGTILVAGSDGWIYSESFGWIWSDPLNRIDGWFYSSDYGWLKNVRTQDGTWFTWSVALRSWGYATADGFETFRHGSTYPTGGNEGWVGAERYGFLWTGSGGDDGWLASTDFGWIFFVDDVWFWSQDRAKWFGVVNNPDGSSSIWDNSAGEFL